MTDHLPECEAYRDECGGVGGCICHHVRACEQRCDKKGHAEVRAWSELSRDNFDAGYAAALDAAREAILKDHRPVPVIECACWWGKDCPECGQESNRVVGYACHVCCNSSGDHAYCDDMHDDTPLHHQDGMWTGPHCPIIASIDALKEKP